jgi:signal transduction histidine kinase
VKLSKNNLKPFGKSLMLPEVTSDLPNTIQMKMGSYSGLQLSVPDLSSPVEDEAWRALGDFFARNTRVVSWRSSCDRQQMNHIQPEIESWLGHPREDWTTAGFWEDLVCHQDRSTFLAQHRGRFLEPGFHQQRYRLQAADGTQVWVEEISHVRSVSGDNLICGVFMDVGREQLLSEEIVRISNFERERIGQDLHDDFCQNLAGIACMSKILEKQLAHISPESAESAAEITHQINEALSRVRVMSHNLSPLQLDDSDLISCLEKLLREIETNQGVACHRHIDNSIDVKSPETRKHLFRLCQEAIRNAIRHGGATQLTLTLARENAFLCRISIEDNGRGFPDRPATSDGLGIRLMKHRCRQFGGTLDLKNGPRGGAIVACTFSNP